MMLLSSHQDALTPIRSKAHKIVGLVPLLYFSPSTNGMLSEVLGLTTITTVKILHYITLAIKVTSLKILNLKRFTFSSPYRTARNGLDCQNFLPSSLGAN